MTTTGETVYCLQCGYDLRGIPQRRCPECGFGYDHAAIRYFSFYQNFDRHDAVRRVISMTALTAALFVSPLTWTFTLGLFGRVALVYAVWLAAIGVHRWVTPREPEGALLSASPGELAWKVVAVTPIPAFVLSVCPLLGSISGTACCVIAWIIFACAPQHYAYACRIQPETLQRELRVRDAVAMTGLIGTAILSLILWLG